MGGDGAGAVVSCSCASVPPMIRPAAGGANVDLGRVDSDDEIVVSRRPGAAGPRYDVESNGGPPERPASLHSALVTKCSVVQTPSGALRPARR